MLLHYEAGQMAASDLHAIIPKLPLAFVGASTEEHMARRAPWSGVRDGPQLTMSCLIVLRAIRNAAPPRK